MADGRHREDRARVVIAGGGVAGLEGALALRDLAGNRAEVELRAPRSEFSYRPFAVGAPYGAAEVRRYELAELARRCGASFVPGGVIAVDPRARTVRTHEGEAVGYDYLLLASGAKALWAVPGAVTFWGVAEENEIADVLHRLRSGRLQSVVFTMPSGASWTLPAYELALISSRQLAHDGIEGTTITVVTPEEAPLIVFGRSVADQVGTLLEEQGIEVVAGAHPVEFDGSRLRLAPGDPVAADAVISLPRLEGRRIDGVPQDAEGFVAVDHHCRAIELDRVFAAGDVTNFPVKHGGIAVQQADVAAAAIAAELGGEIDPPAFDPVLRGVLWTGAEPRYLYGHLAGGHGETSRMEEEPPWTGEGKIIGGHLGELLG